MAIYAIADLHLSTAAETDKSMEVFGRRWAGYTEKLIRNWSRLVAPGDNVVIPGDISWATTLEEALPDLTLIDSLPGTKYLMKGNHDFWWASMKKNTDFCREHALTTLRFLYHDAVRCENLILCGTRGWFTDEAPGAGDRQIAKLINREAIRLDLSLREAIRLRDESPGCEVVAFFHFPPVWDGEDCRPLTDLLRSAGVTRCYHGHIHGVYYLPPWQESEGLRVIQCAADYLDFVPLFVPQNDAR